MRALRGVGVLVTRPVEQTEPLCRLLESMGATTLRLPAIGIEGGFDIAALLHRVALADPFDFVIFTSANAVKFGSALLGAKCDRDLAAIGPATARALAEAGHEVNLRPAGGFDSESLLRHPAFSHLTGRRVLLVKGLHGREFLQEELVRRGADVLAASVYRRVPIDYTAAELAPVESAMSSGTIQVVTATSVEIAVRLLELATPLLRGQFERVHWLVPGGRVAESLRAGGLAAPILTADSADDQDLAAALLRWRSSASSESSAARESGA